MQAWHGKGSGQAFQAMGLASRRLTIPLNKMLGQGFQPAPAIVGKTPQSPAQKGLTPGEAAQQYLGIDIGNGPALW